MTRNKFLSAVCFFAIIETAVLFTGCLSGPKILTEFRESRPRSILVMPPLNNSVDVDAPMVFLAASTKPLAESGYYVIPVAVSQEMFKQNGILTAADANEISYSRLNEIFGADCALYITIKRFGAVFQLLWSVVQAEADANLVDLRTGQLLWSGNVFVEESPSTTTATTSGGFAAQLLLSITTAVVDQVVNNLSNASYKVGFRAVESLLDAGNPKGILYGPYHPEYETD